MPDCNSRGALGYGESVPESAGGDQIHRGVHQRRGQPEGHDRTERCTHRERSCDERDYLARAKWRKAAHERGDDYHAGLATFECTCEHPFGAGRPEPCRRDNGKQNERGHATEQAERERKCVGKLVGGEHGLTADDGSDHQEGFVDARP